MGTLSDYGLGSCAVLTPVGADGKPPEVHVDAATGADHTVGLPGAEPR